jgi:hypothetical protein
MHSEDVSTKEILDMRSLLTLTVLLALTAGTAHAQDTSGFMSPSKNISCLVFPDGNRRAIRCDIAAIDSKPKRPADCEQEYGQAFMMDGRGPADRICYGDALTDKPLPVVGYGETFQRGPFSCTVEQTGVTCFNTDRHGFALSRAKQDLF